jgi:hypothetical protein
MAKQLTAAEIKATIDAAPAKYLVGELKPDGYPSTAQLENLLLGSYGEIDNPEPAPQILTPFTFDDVLANASGFLKAVPDTLLTDVLTRINSQDRDGLSHIAAVLHARKVIDDAALQEVTAIVTASKPDPDHPAKVPAPSDAEKFAGRITPKLIAEALGRTAEAATLEAAREKDVSIKATP